MFKPIPPTRPARRLLPGLLTALSLAAALAGLHAVSSRGTSPGATRAARLDELPPTILWAWERPEKLGFIDTRRVGVAYLAGTLRLRGEAVAVRPRVQPLEVPPRAKLLAVVRVETDRREAALLDARQLARAVAAIEGLTDRPNVRAVQIDFDATASERDFYRRMILDLRRALPAGTPLSITALASWCTRDDWLTGLPIDEAVPMLFRMGADDRQIRLHLSGGGDFAPPVCRLSVGVSTDEPLDFAPRRPLRRYVFNPRPWTPESVRDTLENSEHEHDSSSHTGS